MEFTTTDIDSLADELAAMDVTDGEWEALRTMAAISAAATSDDEVAGFGYEAITLERGMKGFGSLSLKLGPPRSDSIELGDIESGVVLTSESAEPT